MHTQVKRLKWRKHVDINLFWQVRYCGDEDYLCDFVRLLLCSVELLFSQDYLCDFVRLLVSFRETTCVISWDYLRDFVWLLCDLVRLLVWFRLFLCSVGLLFSWDYLRDFMRLFVWFCETNCVISWDTCVISWYYLRDLARLLMWLHKTTCVISWVSPEILGFKMEKNNIKLNILGSVHYVLFYYLWKVPKFPLSRTSFFDEIQNGRQAPCWSCNSWTIWHIF